LGLFVTRLRRRENPAIRSEPCRLFALIGENTEGPRIQLTTKFANSEFVSP
jgi:hypothetical protein